MSYVANTAVAARRSTSHPGLAPKRLVPRAVRFIILAAFAVFFVVPVLWLFLATTRTNTDLLQGPPIAFGSFHNLAVAWNHLLTYNNEVIVKWITNSIVYSIGGLVFAVFACIPAGYALATMRFAGRKVLLAVTLIVMIIPGSALVLPLFLEVAAVHLLDTGWAVVLPTAFFPFGVYLTYIYYASTLSVDLLDAARVDGCGEARVFTRIAVPLAKPAISLVAFFGFTANWNNYFLPFVMLSSDHKYNLPVGLAALIQGSPGVHPAFASELPIYGPEEALAGVITALPVMAMFLFSQRYMIAGMLGGATKD